MRRHLASAKVQTVEDQVQKKFEETKEWKGIWAAEESKMLAKTFWGIKHNQIIVSGRPAERRPMIEHEEDGRGFSRELLGRGKEERRRALAPSLDHEEVTTSRCPRREGVEGISGAAAGIDIDPKLAVRSKVPKTEGQEGEMLAVRKNITRGRDREKEKER